MASILILTLSAVAYGLSFCQKECEPIMSRLDRCGLPPLRSNFTIYSSPDTDTKFRNVTGQADDSYTQPATFFIEDLQTARCFCTDARLQFDDCAQCLNDDYNSKDLDLKDVPIYGEFDMIGAYRIDCMTLGYYRNSTMAYPSTTRAEPPAATASPDVALAVHGVTRSCREVIGIVQGQIVECDLTSLDAEYKPSQQLIDIGEYSSFSARILFNREAGECLCTLPVLRRFQSVDTCLQDTPREILYCYESDCASLGYWPDNERVYLEDDPTSTNEPSQTQSPEPTDSASHRHAVNCWLLSIALIWAMV